jgi:hypothetical protein
VHLHEEKVFI